MARMPRSPEPPDDGSLVLRGALLLDGTGSPGRRADVEVVAGRVARVGEVPTSAGAVEVDLDGCWLTPGFVDIHTHSDLTLLSDPRAMSTVLQGVTTEVVGNCGLAPAPLLAGVDVAAVRAAVSYLDLDPAVAWDWEDLVGYRRVLAERGPAVHVATLVGHLPLHASVCGFGPGAATAAQRTEMAAVLAAELAAGAFGLSTGLVYAPLTTVTEEELLALGAVVAEAGAVFTWHVRDYADDLVASVQQALRVAERTGCRTQVSHLQAVGRRNWPKVQQVLELVQDARGRGVDVGVDAYPYAYGNAPMSQLLPAWAQLGPASSWSAALGEPGLRRRVARHWAEHGYIGWDEVVISRLPVPDPATGRSVAEVAAERGVDADTVALDLLQAHGTGVLAVMAGRSEDVLAQVLAHPAAVVASDGLSLDPGGPTGAGVPHPRSYGCFPRYLARYVEHAPAPLGEAVARCTSRPAARIGLDAGRVAPGAAADLVALDPRRLADTATVADPQRHPDGVVGVWVDGIRVAAEGRHTGARPGRVLQRTPGRR